ncbi:hypothetical protein DYB25_007559, partial [Aphanomyces astaci]
KLLALQDRSGVAGSVLVGSNSEPEGQDLTPVSLRARAEPKGEQAYKPPKRLLLSNAPDIR